MIDVLGKALSLDAPEPLRSELHVLLADLQVDAIADRRILIDFEPAGTLRFVDTTTHAVIRDGIEPTVGAATTVWWLNVEVAAIAPHVLLHAACVGDQSAVLLPGTSGAGKSTLAAHCLADGLSYLSDEYAAIDRGRGVVVPYAKPLDLADRGLVAASTLRPGAVGGSLAPSAIIFPRFDHGAPVAVTELTPRWTLLALAAHATNLARLGSAALPWLASLALTCPAWQITYGDSTDAVVQIRELAAGPASPLRPTPEIDPITPTTTTVAVSDELAVLDSVTGKLHLLSRGAAQVWIASTGTGGNVAAVADVALERMADRGLDSHTIHATIDQLFECGLLAADETREDHSAS